VDGIGVVGLEQAADAVFVLFIIQTASNSYMEYGGGWISFGFPSLVENSKRIRNAYEK
jgi:hypothetical protein